jgi:ornithine cyclodeaminase
VADAIPASTRAPLWLTESDVTGLLGLDGAIDALEHGLGLEARGDALNMEKTHVRWGKGQTLHALGASFPRAGLAATKTWAHTGRGATPLLTLFDADDGSLRAIVEAFALGQLRTAAVSAVATARLAAPEAAELAIVGTGAQALPQVAAVAAVRPLRRVRVFSPDAEHRAAFAERVRTELGLAADVAASVEDAVAGAPIVTLVTRATAPILSAEMLARGSHVNAVGAITPERAEFARDLFARCEAVVVDSVPAVQALSREFTVHYGSGIEAWDRVRPLARIVADGYRRPARADVTLFKAMGMGISDLSLALRVYETAVQRGVGRRLEPPARAAIRWRSARP